MSTPANLSEQVLALPEGAGSERAGQTFQADPQTGAGRYSIRIETLPGPAASGPSLALTYSTHGGNGIAGLGWSLGLASVERRTDKGLPTYADDRDTFTLQGDELLPLGGDSYGLRTDTRFARLRHVRAQGRNVWESSERNGVRVIYGAEPDHRLHDGTGRIAVWYVSSKRDAHGNEVRFAYTRDGSTRQVRLTSVTWAGCYRVVFAYEPRPDPIASWRAGFEHRQDMRLSGLDVEVRRQSDGAWHAYRSYVLRYALSAVTGRSLLAAVTVAGTHADGTREELPPLTFAYAASDLTARRWHTVTGAVPGGSLRNRNLTLVYQSGGGLPDVLETTATGHWLRQNIGGAAFDTPRQIASPAHVRLDQPGVFISDMSGDGRADLAVAGGRRVYRGTPGGGWGAAIVSARAPSVDLDAPDVRVADLNGDGIPDALRSGTGPWVYFENLGDGTWAPGVTVPKPPAVPFDNRRVRLVDVTGDGIPDLVYTDRRQVLVWPGRGRGHFAQPYRMAHAPDLGAAFDPDAVRWIDLTGSGLADLLYTQAGRVVVCFNQAGTSLGPSVEVARVTQTSGGHVEPVDLLGAGGQGLLFTDEQPGVAGAWRYLELFPAGAPDLLTTIDNGIGATTTLTYGSSAAHWLRDRRAGRPWLTSMPSAQRVVDSVTTFDSVTGNTVGVSYRYHHGVYDGEEREFRGFARVEQIDREAGPDDPRPLAPVLVRRWYHTGAPLDLRGEYAPLPDGALEDEVPDLPWARRSLRGRLRRAETYALDGVAAPYSVRETAYRVFPIRNTPATRLYTFAPLPVRTRLTYSERTAERRVLETQTVYDLHSGPGYGLPVRHTERAPGRPGSFATAHEQQQTQPLERYTVTTYLNRDEGYDQADAPGPPAYLAGLPHTIARYGVVDGGPILLSKELCFYDGEPYRGLGYPGTGTAPAVERGRPSARLSLAFTDDVLAASYPANSGATAAFLERGHYLTIGQEHYIHAERFAYDTRGVVTGVMDPNGQTSHVAFDAAYGLFPIHASDAAGNVTTFVRGELPFQVDRLIDPNGNTTGLTYSPSGTLASRSVQGKLVDGVWQGDPPSHPTDEHHRDYGHVPVRVTTRTRRERLGGTVDMVRYLDGLGRAVQERHTAEPDPGTGLPRYRVSGWRVFNHKGLVVRRYQPTFHDDLAFAPGQMGTATIDTWHDPVGRPVRIEHADGTFESAVYHPWAHTSSDRNDNAGHLASDDPRYGDLLDRFRQHLETPVRRFVDAFGREIAVAEDTGDGVAVSRTVLDLNDRIVEVWDGRVLPHPTWRFGYDLAGRRIYAHHETGAGERHLLADAAGNAIWSRDAIGVETTRWFDALNRPVREMSSGSRGTFVRRLWRYVDQVASEAEMVAYRAANVVGRLVEARDQAGVQSFEYDWRGLATRTRMRFWDLRDAAGRDWTAPDADLWTMGSAWDRSLPDAPIETIGTWLLMPGLPDPVSLDVVTTYDAGGKPTSTTWPAQMRTRCEYGAGGLLHATWLDTGTGGEQPVVESTQYDAWGHIVSRRFGNGVETLNRYDPDLQRLAGILTRRIAQGGSSYQDLEYRHDPTGNPLHVIDRLADVHGRDARLVPNTRTFEYDARYRLIGASGTMHTSAADPAADIVVPAPAASEYLPYACRYAYDMAGNLIESGEYGGPLFYKTGRIDLFNGTAAEAGGFSGPDEGLFRYDANGNATRTPRHDALGYTHDNQLSYVATSGGTKVRYLRQSDRRVLRLSLHNGTPSLSVYLGPFEYHVGTGAGASKAVLHVEGHGRVAQAERVLAGTDPDSLALCFVHADHLGSGHVLTTAQGDLLSQEEFFPYGRASDRRDGRNRYRFIGVERDRDTGLCMTGPRTYDPVIGRFLQPDPLAPARFRLSPYVYASGSPIRRLDPNGYADHTTDETSRAPQHTVDPNAGGTFDPDNPGGPQGPPDGERLREYDRGRAREAMRRDIREYVRFEETGGWYAQSQSELGRRQLEHFGRDSHWAGIYGQIDGAESLEAQRMLRTVTELGAETADDLRYGERAIEIAESQLEGLAHRESAARAAAGMAPRAGTEAAGQVSRARLALRGAGRSFLKGIPVIGLVAAPETIAQAREQFNQGDYVGAGLTTASMAYDPVDWGMTLHHLSDFVSESWDEYERQQFSEGVAAELRRMSAEE